MMDSLQVFCVCQVASQAARCGHVENIKRTKESIYMDKLFGALKNEAEVLL